MSAGGGSDDAGGRGGGTPLLFFSGGRRDGLRGEELEAAGGGTRPTNQHSQGKPCTMESPAYEAPARKSGRRMPRTCKSAARRCLSCWPPMIATTPARSDAPTSGDICMHVCVCGHACMHACMYVSMYGCMDGCIWIRICVCICTCICVCTCACICIYYVCMYM